MTAIMLNLVSVWRRLGVDDSLFVFTQVLSLLLPRFRNHQ